jgi:hypothetical protein
MRIKGQDTSPSECLAIIPRLKVISGRTVPVQPITLVVRRIGDRINAIIDDVLPQPRPKKDLIRDPEDSTKILRDPISNKPILEENWDSTVFQKAVKLWSQRVNVWVFYECTKEANEIEWKAAKPETLTPENLPVFLDCLIAEAAENGISHQDIALVVKEHNKLSNNDDEFIERYKEDFLAGKGAFTSPKEA